MAEEPIYFHYQEYRSVAYDLLSSANEDSPTSAFGTSVKGTFWTILGVYEKPVVEDGAARIRVSNPRNPADEPEYFDISPYAKTEGLTYFALTYSGEELSFRVEEDEGYPTESIRESFPARIDITVENPAPYKRMLVYSANMSRDQINRVWTLMHYELKDGDYRPYAWPETASQFAQSVYGYLPEAFRTHDENDETTLSRYPFLRYLEGALKYGSNANDLAEEVGENLFDPDNARDEWLRWVSQILGLGTSKALTPSEIRTRIRAIAEIGSPAVGTRPHIASITRQYLQGYRSVFVIPSATNQWVINLILRTNEIPDEDTGRIVRGVMASGAVPAGHYVRVLLATTTWEAYDNAVAELGGTWDAHAGTIRTWADNDSLGTNLEETPDPEAPLPEN